MSKKIINVAINGIAGRMGKVNAATIDENNMLNLSGAVESSYSSSIGKDIGLICGLDEKGIKIESDLNIVLEKCDIFVDFTNPEATINVVDKNKRYKKALIIGTTGLTNEQINYINDAAKDFPVVQSPNFSIGVNILFKITELVSKLLNVDKGYDLEIIELHHRHKKDSPSGTALKLLDIASKNTDRDINNTIYVRKGFIGERDINEIGMSSIRAGDIVGEHTVMFSNEGERLELTHKAHNRKTFSMGVIQAIFFIADKKKGFFTMKDVLNL